MFYIENLIIMFFNLIFMLELSLELKTHILFMFSSMMHKGSHTTAC